VERKGYLLDHDDDSGLSASGRPSLGPELRLRRRLHSVTHVEEEMLGVLTLLDLHAARRLRSSLIIVVLAHLPVVAAPLRQISGRPSLGPELRLRRRLHSVTHVEEEMQGGPLARARCHGRSRVDSSRFRSLPGRCAAGRCPTPLCSGLGALCPGWSCARRGGTR